MTNEDRPQSLPRRAQPAPDRRDPIESSKPRPAPAAAPGAPAPSTPARSSAAAPRSRPRKAPTEVLHADIDAELSYYVEDLRAATGRTKRDIVESALREYRDRNPLA
ncbi:MAG: hypothetical protein DI630_17970 [Gordonia sp. (in: high G+C Gram-positive bacteria)]|nr:MAG: hypothetical protein DI630_17970 [Gordonia sp. (in: high G+C Gram-positive bacteria)]